MERRFRLYAPIKSRRSWVLKRPKKAAAFVLSAVVSHGNIRDKEKRIVAPLF